MPIALRAITVHLQDAELHIRPGSPIKNKMDCNLTDVSMLWLRIEDYLIEVWFVNLERCRQNASLIRYLTRQMQLMLWYLDVDLHDFENDCSQDAVHWITISPGHKVLHLENLADV
jgi:hypothetical protein